MKSTKVKKPKPKMNHKPTMPDDCVIEMHHAFMGLTKRELFAAMALNGIYANSKRTYNPITSAELSVMIADALIENLNKPKGDT